jgi:hypothetical protein
MLAVIVVMEGRLGLVCKLAIATPLSRLPHTSSFHRRRPQ